MKVKNSHTQKTIDSMHRKRTLGTLFIVETKAERLRLPPQPSVVCARGCHFVKKETRKQETELSSLFRSFFRSDALSRRRPEQK